MSPGIGIEVWLPTAASWNERIRAYGSGGWAGSSQADVTRIGGGGDGNDLHVAAAGKGYVVGTSDHGHGGPGNGSFAIVMKRDLGANVSSTKLNAVGAAAVAACGGTSLGFLLDSLSCRYDPTKDAAALCSGVTGNGGVIGRNTDPTSCVTLAEATAINKMWYGQTVDGSVPDPAVDNSSGPSLSGSSQLWFGLTRGTSLGALAGTGPFFIASDQVALELLDPTYATPSFTNATGNGTNRWSTLDYSGLTIAAAQGVVLQPQFSNINTDNPDLAAFNRGGGKPILYHGLADNLIPTQGSINYYSRVEATMGGTTNVQTFFRFYLVPGLGHSGRLSGVGSLDPATGRTTSINKVPLPQTALGRDELFTALQNWVENSVAPGRMDISSADSSVSLPLCVYPQKVTYGGSGAITAAASYTCQ